MKWNQLQKEVTKSECLIVKDEPTPYEGIKDK